MKDSLNPREIVMELDRYIIGQNDAKRFVAIALRNRWRRQQVPEPLRDEIAPKNIIMIGPTGVGKTEIARRLANLTQSPFLKVEASKYTEVGYVGRDVESMIRDLTKLAVNMVKDEETRKVSKRARELAEERVLDLLIPPSPQSVQQPKRPPTLIGTESSGENSGLEGAQGSFSTTREKMRSLLREGKLDNRLIEIAAPQRAAPMVEILAAGRMEEMETNLKEMFGNIFSKGSKRRKLTVVEALEVLAEEEENKLIDMDKVVRMAIELVEQSGIIFIDEIDKIASRSGPYHGADVSREGVQRDLLPIVEGATVATKYGMVKTDHILFIASGAFHMSKPSDLAPELQGRFPIRVELAPLTEADFVRILTEPQNALIKQYIALLATEGIELVFEPDAIREIAKIAAEVNERTENIGARRLHTVMERLLEEISFDAPEMDQTAITITASHVRERLAEISADEDLSRFIL